MTGFLAAVYGLPWVLDLWSLIRLGGGSKEPTMESGPLTLENLASHYVYCPTEYTE